MYKEPGTRMLDALLSRYFGRPEALPISMSLGGRRMRGMADAQDITVDIEGGETVHRATLADGLLALELRLRRYQGADAIEWVATLTNVGERDSPIVSDWCAADLTLALDAPLRVWHCNGDFYSPIGYTQYDHTALGQGFELETRGGRGSDGAFPYLRIRNARRGYALAIGWPGHWRAGIAQNDEGVELRAGQADCHFSLRPGECARTPSIVVLCYEGGDAAAVNAWRRFYRAHIMPMPGGEPLTPLLASACTDPGNEFTRATEENQLRYMNRYFDNGFELDVWWIDAGWYPCYSEAQGENYWPDVGNWRADPARFPEGLSGVSEAVHARGGKFLLWFEPERAVRGSLLSTEHPQFFTSLGAGERNLLLNLGDAACRAFMADYLDEAIKQYGVDIYRQDFNFDPLPYWRRLDAPDRVGMAENLHIQGYLWLWDELLRRNPGLMIDSCSSGGRRNDIETMKRAVPLHYSDNAYGNHPVKQDFLSTLAQWIPYYKETPLAWDVRRDAAQAHEQRRALSTDVYSFLCGTGPMTMLIDIDMKYPGAYDLPAYARLVEVWREMSRAMLWGDLYALTAPGRTGCEWLARQYDEPERDEGYIQLFRHADCALPSIELVPQGLKTGLPYVAEDMLSGTRMKFLGGYGFTATLPARGATVWRYALA